jgi:hypothetical protein
VVLDARALGIESLGPRVPVQDVSHIDLPWRRVEEERRASARVLHPTERQQGAAVPHRGGAS